MEESVRCDESISMNERKGVQDGGETCNVGLETVALKKRQEAELEVAEDKMLRFSLGVTRMDRIRNENIRGTAHVRCSGDKVRDGLDMYRGGMVKISARQEI